MPVTPKDLPDHQLYGGLKTGIDAQRWREGSIDFHLKRFGSEIAKLSGLNWKEFTEIRRICLQSPTVLWLEELRAAAVNGSEHFIGRSVPANHLLPPSQLWVFSVDLDVPLDRRAAILPPKFDLAACLISSAQDRKSIVIAEMWTRAAKEFSAEENREANEWILRRGIPPPWALPRIVPSLIDERASSESKAGIAAMIEFLNLELVELIHERLPRPERRRRERDGADFSDPEIRTVALRRKHLQRSGIDAGRDTQVIWSCRWIVSGHWRRQWYPSAKENRPIFIAPHIKGPDDKPIKTETATKVFVVSR